MSRKPTQHGRIGSMALPVPNETRLQELQTLAQRRQETLPGPGSYEVVSATGLRPCSTSQRRRHQQQLDGPVYLQPGESSLRSRQMDSTLLNKDSGVSPTAYDGLMKKDACLTRAPTPKIGTASRGGASPVSAGQLCLSISRSLNSGLNWMKPLPLQQLQEQLANRSSSGAAAARGRLGLNSSSGSKVLQAVGRSRSPSPRGEQQRQKGDESVADEGFLLPEQHQQQQQWSAKGSAGVTAGPVDSSGDQQQEQQEHSQQQPLQDTPSRGRSHTPSSGQMPWQLAKSIAEWDAVMEALNQHQIQQIPNRQHLQREQRQKEHDSALVLEQQQVLQHMSAARAAEAVAQLAARRQRWQELK